MSKVFMLTREQIARIKPYFPQSHGVERVDDRRVISGIMYVIRNGLQWKDAPTAYGPHKTLDLSLNIVNMIDLPVIKGGDEVDAEAEAFAARPVAVGQDAETLEGADDVLDDDALAGLGAIGVFLFFCQRMKLGFFERFGRVRVFFLKAL